MKKRPPHWEIDTDLAERLTRFSEKLGKEAAAITEYLKSSDLYCDDAQQSACMIVRKYLISAVPLGIRVNLDDHLVSGVPFPESKREIIQDTVLKLVMSRPESEDRLNSAKDAVLNHALHMLQGNCGEPGSGEFAKKTAECVRKKKVPPDDESSHWAGHYLIDELLTEVAWSKKY